MSNRTQIVQKYDGWEYCLQLRTGAWAASGESEERDVGSQTEKDGLSGVATANSTFEMSAIIDGLFVFEVRCSCNVGIIEPRYFTCLASYHLPY